MKGKENPSLILAFHGMLGRKKQTSLLLILLTMVFSFLTAATIYSGSSAQALQDTRCELYGEWQYLRLSDTDTDAAQVRRQKIGFIFQDFRLFPEYTVRDNILIPFYLDHRTPDEQMLRKLTEILGIAEKLDARPSQISGGQQQRVAIARALIGKPRIVFADEPTGNLDTRTGEDTMKLLTECAAEFGQTLIVVTHNPEIAKKAQQIIRIEDGCILKGL